MEIKLIKFPTEDDWLVVKKCALVTIGKDSNRAPDQEWRHKILEARHSPIRELRFLFYLEGVPYYSAMHLVRHHEGCQPYVRSQRTDRTGIERDKLPQDSPVDLMWSMNAEALMVIANKRLCNLADPMTRKIVKKMCRLAEEQMPEFKGLLVPACVYSGICHEMFPCGNEK